MNTLTVCSALLLVAVCVYGRGYVPNSMCLPSYCDNNPLTNRLPALCGSHAPCCKGKMCCPNPDNGCRVECILDPNYQEIPLVGDRCPRYLPHGGNCQAPSRVPCNPSDPYGCQSPYINGPAECCRDTSCGGYSCYELSPLVNHAPVGGNPTY